MKILIYYFLLSLINIVSILSITCPLGTFRTYNIVKISDESALGYYQILEPGYQCKACPIGRYGGGGLAIECSKCPNGWSTTKIRALNKGECDVCSKGYYLMRTIVPSGFRGRDTFGHAYTCKPCEKGSYSPGGINSRHYCEKCPGDLFTFPEFDIFDCVCPPGTQRVAGTDRCGESIQ